MTSTFKILLILFVLFLAVLTIIGVYIPFYNRLSTPMGFNRNFESPEFLIKDTIPLGYTGYYFTGAHDNSIFLGHKSAPAHILRYNLKTKDTIHLNFNIDRRQFPNLDPDKLKLAIQYPHTYFVDGSNGIFIKGNLINKNINETNELEWRFDNYIQIDSNTIAFRTYDMDKQQNMLAVINSIGKASDIYHPKKQQDGIFDTDGRLFHKNNDLIYLLYYRNEFLVFDNTLKLQYAGKTIDTISTAQIDISTLDNTLTISGPPLRVNKNLFINHGKLYIESMIKSNNQSLKKFQQQVTIDVYDLKKGTYLHSFYFPKINRKRPVEYTIHKDKLMAIFDKNLVIFHGY
ncbi:hypothetical protein E0K83_12430 [Gramella sp. BOM4]|nr:hypothetical protein [Christiangramia bathymodioli]